MLPLRANLPTSPTAHTRPSSLRTVVSAPTVNLGDDMAVPSSARAPAAPVSDAPKLSRIATLGSAARICSRTPADSGAPPLPMANNIDRSTSGRGVTNSASANGRAMASPMVDTEVTTASDTSRHTSIASKRFLVYRTKQPPAVMALPMIHWPPPCIIGPIDINRARKPEAAASSPSCSTRSMGRLPRPEFMAPRITSS